ncbi:DNA-3-methyladenine glycosylase I [Aestuariicella hydrocarbonica]|uniref:DNA-3-methyladenine glycosylase I n=1 Tax=Pseudomaricurvus hydrocarbonicus TaxID=1470433 RepID=A0A9E5JSK2_9GAMM|nr:DNA-3-methyladenine glycosylase I [Aestuariicella hydrocarbonica]NHO64783.1 DNA-3-methyladenine glycosylase I [Aestuariicella hydrocarbonica]
MRAFQSFYETAVLHKGSVEAVESNLPELRTANALRKLPDDRYLSEISRRIFRAGLKHSMVDAKWPAFEECFFGFDPYRVAMMSDEELEALTHEPRIIRHFGKIKAVRANATWVLDVAREYGSFGKMIADWPSDHIVDLWALMKKQGTQLGGHSAARFLRMVGKDGFLLTDDVVSVLKAEGVVDKAPTSKRDLQLVQEAFNTWQAQSGRPLAEISRILSFTTNSR